MGNDFISHATRFIRRFLSFELSRPVYSSLAVTIHRRDAILVGVCEGDIVEDVHEDEYR